MTPLRNPLTRSATMILVFISVAWLTVMGLVAGGIVNLPTYLVLAAPLVAATAGFFLWLAWLLLATACYRVRARFAHRRPRRR